MHIESQEVFSGKTQQIEWSAARLSKEGEAHCGDRYFIRANGNKVLMAAIDGVGHGENAKIAAKTAMDTLESHVDKSLITLVKRCHSALKHTRGAVMSLAVFDMVDNTVSWISVGNVDGVLIKADGEKKNRNIILRGGIVGYRLPPLQASIFPVSHGDLLVLTTDGVENGYIDSITSEKSPLEIVENVSSNYFRRSDDALIFVARYVDT